MRSSKYHQPIGALLRSPRPIQVARPIYSAVVVSDRSTRRSVDLSALTVRRHAAAQPNLCPLAAPPQSTRLPPLVPAEPRSYPPYHGLPGIKPEQPNPPKETASAAGLPTPARRRSYPRASPPTQHPHQLQQSRARRAGSPAFPGRPALPHQHHVQPRHQIALFAKSARACMHGGPWPDGCFKVGVRV